MKSNVWSCNDVGGVTSACLAARALVCARAACFLCVPWRDLLANCVFVCCRDGTNADRMQCGLWSHGSVVLPAGLSVLSAPLAGENHRVSDCSRLCVCVRAQFLRVSVRAVSARLVRACARV